MCILSTANNDIAAFYIACQCKEKFNPNNPACSETVKMFNDSIGLELERSDYHHKLSKVRYLEGMKTDKRFSDMMDFWIESVNLEQNPETLGDTLQ